MASWCAASLLLVAGVMSVCFGCCSHPTDEELIERFRQQRDQFEQLASAFYDEPDMMSIVRRDGEVFGVPETRARYYQRLLGELDLLGVRKMGDKEVRFAASECPFPFPSLKGYSYDKRSQVRKVPDVDRAIAEGARRAHKLIEGHWYLYYLDQGGS